MKIKVMLVGLLAAMLAVPVMGAKVLIDFGDNTSFRGASVTNPDSNGNYWNSVDSTKYWSYLTNSAGSATSIGFGFGTAGSSDSYNGPAGATSSGSDYTNAVIDAAALGVFGNQAAAFDYYTSSTLTIQGLDPTKKYNLTFFGSHKWSTDTSTVYTVYTSNDYLTAVTSASLNVQKPGSPWLHNSNTVVTISNVSPQYASSIWIGYKGAGGNNGYLNAMSIEEVPTFTVTGRAGTHGTVSPASTNVSAGSSVNFTVTADSGYRILTLTTNGTAVAGMSFDDNSTTTNLVLSNIQTNVTVAATFVTKGAELVLIDFGDDASWAGHTASATSPDRRGIYWNSVDSTKYWTHLTNSAGRATAINFGFGTAGGVDSYNGPAGVTYNYSNAVIDTEALGALGNQAAAFDYYTSSTFTIQGLNPAKKYNLTFYGSHKYSTDDATVYTVYASNDYLTAVTSASLNVQVPGSSWLHNSNTVVTISNVSPQYANSFWIGYKGSGGNNGYLNAMSIELVPTCTLTVNGGSGGGEYTNGHVQAISANVITGKTFAAWTGDTQYVANASSASTTVTMLSNVVTLTATYVDTTYTLTVNSGSGSGSYTNGHQVAIDASVISGKTFASWTGDTGCLADSNAASTTVTMPAQVVSLTATYVDTTYTLAVNSGSGSGSYTNGQVVMITADAPASGYAFANWSGDTVYLTDSNDANTAVTMPLQAVSVTATYIATEQYTTNGTPYSWLNQYGIAVTDDTLDQDADGLKTWQEYVAGTNPTNAASVLKAAQAARNVVTWSPVTGRVYSVYWSTNLVKGFTALSTNIVYPQGSYTNTAPDSRINHYQIKVQLQ